MERGKGDEEQQAPEEARPVILVITMAHEMRRRPFGLLAGQAGLGEIELSLLAGRGDCLRQVAN